jgi:hypothetical protein
MPTQDPEKWPLSASPNFPGKRSYPRVSWRFFANNAPRTLPPPRLSLTCTAARHSIPANDRPDHFALPHLREARWRRDGCRLES